LIFPEQSVAETGKAAKQAREGVYGIFTSARYHAPIPSTALE